MKVLAHIAASVMILSVFLVPRVTHAQLPSLIVCNGPDCGFDDLVQLGINLIKFMIIISTFFATAVFTWVGFKLLTSGGNPGALEDAKKTGLMVLKGYLWILGAWLLVYTIEKVLLSDDYSSLLGSPK